MATATTINGNNIYPTIHYPLFPLSHHPRQAAHLNNLNILT